MRALLLAPLLLAACSSAWPTGSYVQPGSDADASVLQPAISDCTANIVPANDTTPVSTVVASLDPGMFIRVSTSSATCSQYFSRASGSLKPDGPIMVYAR